MKISIIIPMYNAKKTIITTIKSVLHQSYEEEIEVIVINDGSNDGSEKLLAKFIEKTKTQRLIKLIHQENHGVSHARNRGIDIARGEYIAFLDSDDRWHPQKLELLSYIMKEYALDFIAHSHVLNDNFKRHYKSIFPRSISFNRLLIKNIAPTPCIMLKREICEKFNEDMTHTEDHELWLRIAIKHPISYIDLPLTRLGRLPLSKGGLSANRWAMRKGELQMYTNLIHYKKALFVFLPLLILFSLIKHLRQSVRGTFEK